MQAFYRLEKNSLLALYPKFPAKIPCVKSKMLRVSITNAFYFQEATKQHRELDLSGNSLFSADEQQKNVRYPSSERNISILPDSHVQISVATNHYLLAAYIKFLHVFNQGCRVN